MSAYLESITKGLLRLNSDETSFGRKEGDYTFPDDKLMSTVHFRVIFKGDKYFVEDLSSKNGTKLNGGKIDYDREYLLVPGGIIEAGDQTFKLVTTKK